MIYFFKIFLQQNNLTKIIRFWRGKRNTLSGGWVKSSSDEQKKIRSAYSFEL